MGKNITIMEEKDNALQQELNDLEDCKNENRMKFNIAESKAMYLVAEDKNFCYQLGTNHLKVIEEVEALGILVAQKPTDFTAWWNHEKATVCQFQDESDEVFPPDIRKC